MRKMLTIPRIEFETLQERIKNLNAEIVELKRVAEETRQNCDIRYATIFNNSRDAIGVAKKGIHVMVNPAYLALYGYTSERELIGKPILDLIAPAERESILAYVSLREKGEAVPSVYETRGLRKDGTEFVMDVHVSRYQLQGKTYSNVIIRDITERKSAAEELARAKDELETRNNQLRDLSIHLQNVREDERTRVAREIHDEMGQSLTAIKLELARLRKKPPKDQKAIKEQVAYVAELVESTLQSVKRISTELRPGMLDHIGLTSAIQWQAEEFEKRNGIPCSVVFDPEEINIGQNRSTTVFRIFQETLTNIARHANASKVEALLKLQAGELLLRVNDDGKGITKQRALDAKSLGLIGMRERVHYWGGSFEIYGTPNQGTTVVVRIPLDKPEEAPK